MLITAISTGKIIRFLFLLVNSDLCGVVEAVWCKGLAK